MRAFITGATGFIGGHVARRLRDRGDDVVALVRNPQRAEALRRLGCKLAPGDLSDIANLRESMKGCDSVFHIAASYKVGVKEEQCREMHEANVDGTRNVLEAAIHADADRIVYVSTVGYFGNTKGQIVDETFTRSDLEWLSCYDETKHLAHEVARGYIDKGAPVLIAMPGGVYGPGDTSDLKLFFDLARRGRAKVLMLPGTGFNFLHVEDAATGIILVHDRGELGASYVLGGELSTMGELTKKIASFSGHKPPKRELPVGLMKAAVPIWGLLAPLLKLPPNLRELIKSGDGVTYWATDAKARNELGYSPRDLDTGLKQTLDAWA